MSSNVSLGRSLGAAMLVCAAVSAIAPRAHATLSLHATLAELVHDADEVIVATTLRQWSHRDRFGNVVTDVEVSVSDTYKGECDAGETLVIRHRGGTIDGVTSRVMGAPTFTHDQQQVLFARWAEGQSHLRTVAMSQGRRLIEARADGLWALGGGEGLTTFTRTDGVLKQVGHDRAMPLPRLLESIRSLVANGSR